MQQDNFITSTNNKKLRQGSLIAVLATLLLCFLLLVRNNTNNKATTMVTIKAKPDWSLYQNCALPTVRTPTESLSTSSSSDSKPIFTPSFPNSLDDQILQKIVQHLTGGSGAAAVKSIYAQARRTGLKQCHGGPTTTILCTLVHPLVSLSPSPDNDKYTSRFHSTVIMPLRNPLTVFPAFLQYKAEKYHHQTGQIPVEQWRHQRDESLVSWMQQYRRQITEWNINLSNYHTALYLPYEHVMDPTQGPQLVQKLARVLQQSGFDDILPLASIDSLTEQDYICIWYHSVGANRLQAHHDSGYAEYPDGYLPLYTTEQYQYMAQELEELKQNSSQDLALVQILQEYRDVLLHPQHMDVKTTTAE